MSCNAVQTNDQMTCKRCGTSWDMNDPDPSDCIYHDAFYIVKWGIFYIRHKYRYPGSMWYFTIGRLSIKKWWG